MCYCHSNRYQYLTADLAYTNYDVQGRAKKFLLSSVTHVPSRLMGCALAALLSGQEEGGKIQTCRNFFAPRCKSLEEGHTPGTKRATLDKEMHGKTRNEGERMFENALHRLRGLLPYQMAGFAQPFPTSSLLMQGVAIRLPRRRPPFAT